METREIMNAVLAEFAEELGLDPQDVGFQDDYTCLSVDAAKIIHMRLDRDANVVDVFMELGIVPSDRRLAVCVDMLQANVLFQATDGAALGLDAERDMATLTMRLDVGGMDLALFKDKLERFLTAAGYWAQRIGASEGDSGGSQEPGIGEGFMRV